MINITDKKIAKTSRKRISQLCHIAVSTGNKEELSQRKIKLTVKLNGQTQEDKSN